MHGHVTGLFFFAENTVTGNIYVDTLQMFVFLQIDGMEQERGEILFL
jgi:hypothetical protein